jgi:hypothetical protein
LTPNDFTDLAEAERRLLCFQDRYQQTAAPIDWRFTHADMDRLLHRWTSSSTALPQPDHPRS